MLNLLPITLRHMSLFTGRMMEKAGLDQDVRLGVLEPVPIGEPVKWCHRMVVCAKMNGKPRRTVDFQALNAHATHETLQNHPLSIKLGLFPMVK